VFSCPRRIAAAIEYCIHADDLALDQVIDGERKSFREAAMISVNDGVGRGLEKERVHIRE
jgi:hypothetical protein